MNSYKQAQRAQEVISAISGKLIDSAMHISIHYNSKDVFKCLNKMTDAEWGAWTKQPENLRSIYINVMKGSDAGELMSLAFRHNIKSQTQQVANCLKGENA